jgi:hypothetical protein
MSEAAYFLHVLYIFYDFLLETLDLKSVISVVNIPLFVPFCIQPDDGYLASRNM